MITHEFDWGSGDDDFSDDPICSRCPRTLSEHSLEVIGITHEDEKVTIYDDRSLDIFGNIRSASEDW